MIYVKKTGFIYDLKCTNLLNKKKEYKDFNYQSNLRVYYQYGIKM